MPTSDIDLGQYWWASHQCHPPGEPGMLVVDLSAESLRQARAESEYLYRFRRPELYGSLADIR